MDCGLFNLFDKSLPVIAALVGSLGGYFLNDYLSKKRITSERKREYIIQQLRDFYSPLYSLREEILALSETREKATDATGAAYSEAFGRIENSNIDAKLEFTEKQAPKYTKVIDYNNVQFRNEIFPKYQLMLKIFKDNRWLAEVETCEHFSVLLEFIEIWNRYLNQSIPGTVVTKLEHTEENLKPFYENLKSTFNRLQSKLANGNY